MIVDASKQILGRISSKIAKKLLNGEKIEVINSEKAIVTGKPDEILERYKKKKKRGDPYHGPYYPKKPDKILRRSIRGMLPYKKSKGREALQKLNVFIGNPNNKKGKKIGKNKEEIKCEYLTLEEISKKI